MFTADKNKHCNTCALNLCPTVCYWLGPRGRTVLLIKLGSVVKPRGIVSSYQVRSLMIKMMLKIRKYY